MSVKLYATDESTNRNVIERDDCGVDFNTNMVYNFRIYKEAMREGKEGEIGIERAHIVQICSGTYTTN